MLWKHLSHPKIVPLLGVSIAPRQLISFWTPGSNLLDGIKNLNPDKLGLVSVVPAILTHADHLFSYLTSLTVFATFTPVMLSMEISREYVVLNSVPLQYRPLSQYNILVDNSGHARITDFGLPTVTQDSESPQNTGLYTARWAAPEVLRDGICSKEADIFSFAMVMIEVRREQFL